MKHLNNCATNNNSQCNCNELISDEDLDRAWQLMSEQYTKFALEGFEKSHAPRKNSTFKE